MPLSRAFDITWAAMEKLVDIGKTRMIGVSNFSTPKLKRLLSKARIHPVVNQVELHPYFPQRRLVDFCQKTAIHITAYGPLGCTPVPVLIGRNGPGPLEDKTVTPSFNELQQELKEADHGNCRKIQKDTSADNTLLHDSKRHVCNPKIQQSEENCVQL